jgi:Pyruvate phosphate dikinase, AMP/ATP-binding domain/Cyclic nucleotide-binding domain
VKQAVPLEKAHEESRFGAKAVGLGEALRADLPVPPGVALSGSIVDAVAGGDAEAVHDVMRAVRDLPTPLAVRSSCVDEDGAQASFAGQHLTLLNVATHQPVIDAVCEIWWSANSDSAITYRQRVGLLTRPSVGVVVQSLLAPDAAGVMFTRNPVSGADERLIEASWGLGEAVVSGRVIPDSFRIARSGEILERTPGLKKIAIRAVADGGTVDEAVAPDRVEMLCLDDDQLAQLNDLADKCEQAYGPGRDVEWAFADGKIYLLQCRAVTSTAGASEAAAPRPRTPEQMLADVPLFADLSPEELAAVTRLFRERKFAAGETVTKEGAGGAALFVIGSGTAEVTIRGEAQSTLGPGDYFGEIALIDAGARTATITATTDLSCHGITVWDFRPLVQNNAGIAWKLLESLAARLRDA